MSMFVEPEFSVDIDSCFRYRHRCIGAFEYENPFTYVVIVVKSLLEYSTIGNFQTYIQDAP